MKQLRGQLTDRIKKKSKELLGYEITQNELRLMPYIAYQAVNEKRLQKQYLNSDDWIIINKWEKEGRLNTGFTMSEYFIITKEFWNIMKEIIYIGYVDIKTE